MSIKMMEYASQQKSHDGKVIQVSIFYSLLDNNNNNNSSNNSSSNNNSSSSNNNNSNNNNIIFIRSYATQAHRHKPYIQIHNTVINWKKTNIHVHVKTNRNKDITCTDRDTKKKSWLYILIGLIIHNCISAFKTFYQK